ncbi:MAG TPA: hypothetical protein VFE86_05870 [Ilumatobacteraceae bacterium]|nr:hypothetical protein [Ilumatobacteraceae bacterium]
MATESLPDFAARGDRARARAEELEQRRADLADGLPVTERAVEHAHQRAEEALKRAEEAHHASAQRHIDASRAHRRAAAAHEQAAMLAGDGPGEVYQDAAEHHRDEATRHERAALEQAAAEEADARRQD